MAPDFRAGLPVLALLLAGCVGQAPVNIEAPVPPAPPVCPTVSVAEPAGRSTTPEVTTESRELLDFFADSVLWSAERRAAELRRLRAGPQSGATSRKIAWLEPGKANAPRELLTRPEQQELAGDHRRLLHLLQHLLKVEQELRQERERGARLHDQIERLKALERDLSQREKAESAP